MNRLITGELEQFKLPVVGVEASNITENLMWNVLSVYDKWVGGNGLHYWHGGWFDRFARDFYTPGGREFRYGSWASGQSKLQINPFLRNPGQTPPDTYVFEFYANNSRVDEKFNERLEKQFNYQIAKALKERGIGVNLVW